MTSAIPTRRQLEDALYRAACLCLAVDPESAGGRIRISHPLDHPSGTNPGWKREEDVCFLRVAPYRDPYTRLREVRHIVGEGGELRAAVAYTRAYEAQFICYGPNAMEDAEAIRIGILRDEVKGLLRTRYALYPMAHIDEPVRADELENGQWWGRCDLRVRFYEGVSREYGVPAIEQPPDVTYHMKE